MTETSNNLVKRTWAYLEPPKKFEIAPCSCGNEDTQWSEYEKHLWCDKCKIDFIPSAGGVFDGPIPMQVAKMLGFTFAKINLEDKKIFVLNNNTQYVECVNQDEVFREKMIKLKLFELGSKLEDDCLSYNGEILFNQSQISVHSSHFLKNSNVSNLPYPRPLMAYVRIGYPKINVFDLKINITENKKFEIKKNEDFERFQKYILMNELEYDMKINSSIKNIAKI